MQPPKPGAGTAALILLLEIEHVTFDGRKPKATSPVHFDNSGSVSPPERAVPSGPTVTLCGFIPESAQAKGHRLLTHLELPRELWNDVLDVLRFQR